MLQITIMIFSLIILGISLSISLVWPMAGWSLLVIMPAILLSIYDVLQSY